MSHSDEPASLLGPHDILVTARLRCSIHIDEHSNGFHATVKISDGESRTVGFSIPTTFSTAVAAFDEASAQARSRLERFAGQ